jgi:large subunit ribosomal protein L6
MSRIGKLPISIPDGTDVKIEGQLITVKGPKGTLEREIHERISVSVDGNQIVVRRSDDSKKSKALHGLSRALINNMVIGVSKGFTKTLLVNGVGYKVDLKGSELEMHLGFSHPINFTLPDGISAKVDKQKEIKIVLEGYDKELLGLTAARIRAFRPPEPYKGKGIQYSDEHIIRKAGKAAAK